MEINFPLSSPFLTSSRQDLAETLGRRTRCADATSAEGRQCSVGGHFWIYKPNLRKKLHPGVVTVENSWRLKR